MVWSLSLSISQVKRTSWAGTALIFLFPALVLSTHFGIGLIEFAVLAAALVCANTLWRQGRALVGDAGWIVVAFAVHLLLAAGSLALSGWSGRALDGPVRQLLLMPVIALIVLCRPNPKGFWYGLGLGLFAAACIASYQRFYLLLERAEGFHFAIIFGDVAMALGLMALAAVPLFERTRWAFLPYVSFALGVFVAILSATRGSWVALPVCFIAMAVLAGRRKQAAKFAAPQTKRNGIVVRAIGLAGALFLLLYFTPQLGVADRFLAVQGDIAQFRLGQVVTSIGLRFENWSGAWQMFLAHPLMGVGRANYHQGLLDLVAAGSLDPSIAQFDHAHNELLHLLATQGLFGGLALIFLYAAPLRFFLRKLVQQETSHPYALAGVLLVLAYICFGLTQVLFAHHLGSAFYAAALGFMAGMCRLADDAVPYSGD